MDYQDQLRSLVPEHQYFIGIDSDGCVFDTMEVKQKEFFIPNAMKHFNLFPVAKTVRETWEFVNLYSVYRGNNRFIAILKVFELLAERSEIAEAGVLLPDLTSLREWAEKETKLGNATLRKQFEATGDKSLETVLRWSETINREISEWMHHIPPFPHAKKSIERVSSLADILVVSQTPLEALEHEWHANDLKKYVRFIAAQEHGTKSEHIAIAARSKYPDEKILMIGDARGDMEAARRNGVLFYPIIPGNEDNSWKMFLDEGAGRFINGTFKGSYEDHLSSDFMKSLPDTPTWKKFQRP
jgi:phosphoglycolate phosphatase-like HAD superfamily hydrolase